MKTINFPLGSLLFVTSITCFSQVPALQKRSLLVGGSMDLSFGNYKNQVTSDWMNYDMKTSVSSITFSPQVGYFVAQGLALGAKVNLTRSTTADEGEDEKYTISNFSVGPFMRYYTKAKIFFHGEYTIGKENQKVTGSYDDNASGNLSGWKAGVGYAAFLNDNIALEPHFMYASDTTKERDDAYNLKSTFGRIVVGLTFTLFLPR